VIAYGNLVAPIKMALAVHHNQIAIIERFFNKISKFRRGGIGIIDRNLTPDLIVIQIYRFTR
jgi:hypothetical protein